MVNCIKISILHGIKLMQQQSNDRRVIPSLERLLQQLRTNDHLELFSVCGKYEHFLCKQCFNRNGNRCIVCEETRENVVSRNFQNLLQTEDKYIKKQLPSILKQSISANQQKITSQKRTKIKQLHSCEQIREKIYAQGAYSISLKEQLSLLSLAQNIANQDYENEYLENITFPLFLAIDTASSLILAITVFLQIYFLLVHSSGHIREGMQITLVSLYGSLLWLVIFLMNFMDGFWMGKKSCNRFCRFYESLLNRFLFISALPINILAIFFALPLVSIQRHLKLKHKIPWLFPFHENPGLLGYSLLILPNCVYLMYLFLAGTTTLSWKDDQTHILMPVIFFSLLIIPLVLFMDFRLHQIDGRFKEKERQEKEDFLLKNDRIYLKVFRREKNEPTLLKDTEEQPFRSINRSANQINRMISIEQLVL